MSVSRFLLLPLAFIAVCFITASCGSSTNTGQPDSPSPSVLSPPSPAASTNTPQATATAKPEPAADPIQAKIDQMTLDEKIGQMVIIGLDGTKASDDAVDMISDYRVGGFILYKDNIKSAKQTLTLLNMLKKLNVESAGGIPLWLSVDQEGGKVSRMPNEITSFPSAQSVGAANNDAYSYRFGQAIGLTLKSLGFNMNYAPVLDINSNPDNPVIGSRAFGADADTVSRHGIETMKGLQAERVAAVAKHFPGHGDTSVDSHLDLPVVDKSLKQLEQFELLPFVQAIKQDADAVMVAHLLLPKLDESNPASLSKPVITGLLRDKLGYEGVVMTDDMTMGGIVKHRDIGEAAVLSVLAGTDIVLVGHNLNKQKQVLQALKDSAVSGKLTEEMIERRVHRILSLKAKYALSDEPIENIDLKQINGKIKQTLQTTAGS